MPAPGPTARAARAACCKDMRAEFRHMRADTLGPDLSRARAIVAQVLRTRAVRQAVRQEIRDKKLHAPRGAAASRAGYALEIAANYSHAFVRIAERVLHAAVDPASTTASRSSTPRPRPAAAGQRDRLRALPPQPHGLPAAVVRRSTRAAMPCRTSPRAST